MKLSTLVGFTRTSSGEAFPSDGGNVVGIWPAAMIACAVEHKHILHAGLVGALDDRNRDPLMIDRSRILAGRGISQHSASVQALPPDNPWTGRVMGPIEEVKLN